jgi:mono/diheme cytochrome c family protein
MRMTRFMLISIVVGAAAAACGGSARHEPDQPTGPAPAPVSNDELVARGGQLYGKYCAKCHGDAGQGTDKGPAVVGAGALPKDPRAGAKRDVPFSTAYDVGAWAMKHMPADKPGSLATDEYLAILAFDLKANGVDLGAEPLTLDRLHAIVLHP